MKDEISKGNIYFGRDGSSTPRKKKFLNESSVGLTPDTLWLGHEVSTTKMAKKHIISLFPGQEVFDTPKPEALIKRIFDIATKSGDLVMDAFLGSGTTTAVAHKMGLSYIGIEQGDHIFDYVVKRMKKVIGGEQGGISIDVGWIGGGEFDFYK
ncbi:DNA methyltransferase [Aeromonas hydrophila]